jgi:hypothetical protein
MSLSALHRLAKLVHSVGDKDTADVLAVTVKIPTEAAALQTSSTVIRMFSRCLCARTRLPLCLGRWMQVSRERLSADTNGCRQRRRVVERGERLSTEAKGCRKGRRVVERGEGMSTEAKGCRKRRRVVDRGDRLRTGYMSIWTHFGVSLSSIGSAILHFS